MADWKSSTSIGAETNNVHLIPILPGNYPTLLIYLPLVEGEAAGSDKGGKNAMDIVEDLYATSFQFTPHRNFIVPTSNDPLIISLMDELCHGKDRDYHKGLITHKRGHHEFELVVGSADLNTDLMEKFEKLIRSYLLTNAASLGFSINVEETYPVAQSAHGPFVEELSRVEKHHSQKKDAMKIGVIYGKKGQSSPQEMFQNGEDKCSQAFLDFIKIMGEVTDLSGKDHYMGDMKPGEVGGYYTKWNSIEIIYHVSPFLTSEGHRRLIGNDIAELFFLDEGDDILLNPVEVSKLGTVPQVFVIVQPVKSLYRVGCFSNKNIKKFGPNIPSTLLNAEEMKNLVLTKIYNGLIMCNRCPPMNRLYYVPRQETINAMVLKFPPEKNIRKFKKKIAGPFVKTRSQQLEKRTTNAVQVSIESLLDTLFEWPDSIPSKNEDEKEEPQLLKSYRQNLFSALEGLMDILVTDTETRKHLISEILRNFKDSDTPAVIDQQEKLKEVGYACVNQIRALGDIEQPTKTIQCHILSWNINNYLPCRSQLTPSPWKSFIDKFRTFSNKLDTVNKSYKTSFKNKIRVSEVRINQMFYLWEEMAKCARRILYRLERQHSYFPIIFGVGNILSNSQFFQLLTNYMTSFHLLLNSWDEDIITEEMKVFLLKCQKESEFPDIPLSELLIFPMKFISDLPRDICLIAYELLNIDPTHIPKAYIFSPKLPSSLVDNIASFSAVPSSLQKNKKSATSKSQRPSRTNRSRVAQNGSTRFISKSPLPLNTANISSTSSSGAHKSPRNLTSLPASNSMNLSGSGAVPPPTKKTEGSGNEEEPEGRSLKRSASKRDKSSLRKKTQSVGDSKSPKVKTPLSPVKVSKDTLSQLHEYIMNQNLARLQEMIKHDKERSFVNSTDTSGKTLMHFACVGGNLSILKFLQKNGVELEERDLDGWVPLHIAANFGNFDAMEFLIKNGCDPKLTNKDGNTCLHLYLRSKKMVPKLFSKILDLYLKNGGNINAKNNLEETFLHTAVVRENPEVVQILLKKNASTNEVDSKGQTPLKLAESSHEIASILKSPDSIKDKGSKERENKKKDDPTTNLKPEEKKEMDKKKMQLENDFANAIANTNIPLLKDLIKVIDLNAPLSVRGEPPLHIACGEGNLPVVKFLIKNNAPIHSEVKQIQWPIHNAAMQKHWDVVNYLLQKGHNPDAQNIDLNTCLHYAVRNPLTDVVKLTLQTLFKAGANLDAKNKQGETPLLVAIQRGGSPDMCKFLLELGASVNVKTVLGMTALECCNKGSRKDLVEIIESATANPRRIKLNDLVQPVFDQETESQEQCDFELQSLLDEPLVLNEVKSLWNSAKTFKKLYVDSLRKLAARHVISILKEQLILHRSDMEDCVPNYLYMKGIIGTKKQPLHYYLFDNLLILAIPNLAMNNKMNLKNIIPLKHVSLDEIKYDDETHSVHICYTQSLNKQQTSLEVSVPDTTFYYALKKFHSYFQESEEASEQGGLWLDEFLQENHLVLVSDDLDTSLEETEVSQFDVDKNEY